MSDRGPSLRSVRLAIVSSFSLLAFGIARIAVEGGPRSSPGYNRRKRYAPCPKCGNQVRVGTDGWAYCRSCRHEFKVKLK
jgi:hypothetical protein